MVSSRKDYRTKLTLKCKKEIELNKEDRLIKVEPAQ